MTKRVWVLIMLVAAAATIHGQGPGAGSFNDDFLDKALRVELFLVGDAKEEFITIHHIYQEGIWPESRARLLDPFNNGRYTVKLYDVATNRLIYSRGFDTMFGEYRTTTPAIHGAKRIYPRSVRIPCPVRPALFVIESRDKKNLSHPLFGETIDPADYHLIRETSAAGDDIYEARRNGDPQGMVDLVFIAEGYAAADRDKFKADVDRFSGYLFGVEPYKARQDRFNVRGVFRPSAERGMDEPRQRVFKKTGLGASFNAFDLDRYMLIEEGHRLREMAAQVPYDAIVVLVNGTRYGGGGIYNDYCITTVDNAASKGVFIHEFGHSFAGLADEYYASNVSYNDFYPKGVEPLEPNITALLDPARVKWQDLLSPGLSVPTDWGKDKIESLQAELQKGRQAMKDAFEQAKTKKLPQAQTKKLEEKHKAADKALLKRIEDVRKSYAYLDDKVGVFEGAGYSAKGLYRPMVYCLMIYNPKDEFCLVCQRAISRMIDFYAQGQ